MSADWDRTQERESIRAEERLLARWPDIYDRLDADPDRHRLWARLRCPRCSKLLETVVLDADHNRHLMLRTREEFESGDFTTHHARTATPTSQPDSLTMGRTEWPCPRCTFKGVYTHSRLLELFAIARLVMDTPDITLA